MAEATPPALNVELVRGDFPVLSQEVHGRPLVYLDNAATAHKPIAVIEAVAEYYRRDNANVHRGVHTLSERATFAYERARGKVHKFIGAAETREIVFVRGTTEAINLVAQTYGRSHVSAGDEVLVSEMEHHSNIVPWQLLCQQTGARLVVAPIDDRGELMMDELIARLGPRTKIVAVTHVSNALGTVNPVAEICEAAHRYGAAVVVDGAQSVPHLRVDVQALGCDFYAFSGHKMYAPTGIGVLYGRAELLDRMPPWQGGGEMIREVTFERTTYNDLPYKFEAGTPDIAGAIGLGAAIDYLGRLGLDAIAQHEHELLEYGRERLQSVPGLSIVGQAREKVGVHSFTLDGVHPHDIGTILDHEGVAIRTGHHCAQPVMQRFGVPATARASFALYNTKQDVDRLIDGLHRVRKVML
ncbi:MAG: cysteine desulfurase [Deltaproteobacteria bacterium]|nr:MAG: cysteine desulfurase [Deltaproteobacteria bacterium]